MSKQLVEALRKKREVRIVVGTRTFIAMRPTDLEMLGFNRATGDEQVRRALEFVIGWEGVTEDDIIGGALMDPVKFDRELWMAWACDHSEVWEPIARTIFEAYNEHASAQVNATKN